MTIMYDLDLDYVEIFFKKEANYGNSIDDEITEFKSEKSDEVIGYSFESASRTLFESDLINPSTKLAALLKMIRAKENLTQQQAADRIGGIVFRHYQRLESGIENPTLETIELLMAAFPTTDFSVILKHPRQVVA